MLTARVAAARLSAFERRHQPLRQVAGGVLEPADHVVHDLRTREDIALRGAVFSALVPGPCRRFRPGKRGVLTCQVHDRELPTLLRPVFRQRIRILLPDLLDDRVGREALTEQLQCLRPIAHVHDRLCGGNADVGVGPQHAVAN